MNSDLPLFDGATYDPVQDEIRLSGQLRRVFELMSDGQWWDIEVLAARVGGTDRGISSRVRDLRKDRFGKHIIELKRDPDRKGVWLYRMKV